MKLTLVALLAFAGSAHAATTCTDNIKQFTMDVAGANPRVYVMLVNGAGFDISVSGDASRVVIQMTQAARMTQSPITITYAANVNCVGAGYRTDLVRIAAGDDIPLTTTTVVPPGQTR